jgi:hypothetical protein
MILNHDLFVELDKYAHSDILIQPTTLEDIKTQRIAIKDLDWPEIHTMVKGGYIPSSKYKGFDGYRVEIGKEQIGEAKSYNTYIPYDVLEINDKKEFRSKLTAYQKTIQGTGVFSNFTWKAHNHCQYDDINVLVSGYINGILMYVLEFKYNEPTFVTHVESYLNRMIPTGDQVR